MGKNSGREPSNSMDGLKKSVWDTWIALVEAAFGLSNVVKDRDGSEAKEEAVKGAEAGLAAAAKAYAAASEAMVDALRPPAPRRPRRR